MNSPHVSGASVAAHSAAVRLGTWNMSHWTAPKAHVIATEVNIEVLAVQETHLATFPLECAHGTAHRLGLHLHHGHPVPPTAHAVYGRSCGVGFVVKKGVALTPTAPVGAAWRRLHAMGRLHAVKLPPRTGLPLGMLLLSVYAPLQVRAQQDARERFVALMLEVTHGLDMQMPTLLMGDFNGSADPAKDFLSTSGQRRPVCPLLAHLLGPGGAWVDVHRALLREVPWTFQSVDTTERLSASRIDLILANHAALGLLRAATVLDSVRDGGHSPVLVELILSEPVALHWDRPRPRPPPLLCLSSLTLQQSTEWAALLDKWSLAPQVAVALDPLHPHTASSLSAALVESLQTLVSLAGGWVTRPRHRRHAYDSNALRSARKTLALLHRLSSQLQSSISSTASITPASWPRLWEQLLSQLEQQGLHLPRTTISALHTAVTAALRAQRTLVSQHTRELRQKRHQRWLHILPTLWHERPGVICHWLHALGAPWGTTPILEESGTQCTSVTAVDRAVQQYWVHQVLRRHSSVDEELSWASFLASPFAAHIPTLQWSAPLWTDERVRLVLGHMREGAAPGPLGVPLPVWKALPGAWHVAIARLLNLVESEGVWPGEWTKAYVAMIPKAAGGTRPQDQRPITVLDILYRVWSKGVALAWTPMLQQTYLGQAALGFRAGAGTLHVAQLLTDLMALQKKRRQELWLASFDVEKCYDSLPWWAVFGVMQKAGIEPRVVSCFRSFYQQLVRRFRYGQVEGEPWQATNGLAQGCPASPDLLNILFEPFHRWAQAEGHGVQVLADCRIPSVSFADDVALIARSQAELELLISAYLQWCTLLGVMVTKVQAWTSLPGTHTLRAGQREVSTLPTFKIVGVVLGVKEQLVTQAHLNPRLAKALDTTRRLRMLDLPASVCSLLWRTTVLPQALYGCEVRDIRPGQLTSLTTAGQTAVASKAPLNLNSWRAPEVLSGPPLGDTLVRDPMLEVRERQLRWLQLLVNLPSVVGLVHRLLAYSDGVWREPVGAAASALQSVGWYLQRNNACERAGAWPSVDPEWCYPGSVVLHSVDTFPSVGAVFTDGSVMSTGGAAVVQPDTGLMRSVQVSQPRSSTHCELVALGLGMQLDTPMILSDSQVALRLLKRWGLYSMGRMQECMDRREVRWVLSLARSRAVAPVLEKVKAHDASAVALGHPKAVGNDAADGAARLAASSTEVPLFTLDLSPHGDPVELLDQSGQLVSDVRSALKNLWWERRRQSCSARRPWMDKLYPQGVAINWPLSTVSFRRPVVSGDVFVHPVAAPVVKWLARVRAGCLASRMRLFSHRMGVSPACPCCAAEEEDEEHMMCGCPGTGSIGWLSALQEVWAKTAKEVSVTVPPPPVRWLTEFRLLLLAALIPSTLVHHLPLSTTTQAQFLRELHINLARNVAEWLRRREAHIVLTASSTSSSSDPSLPPSAPSSHTSLPLDRQLLPVDLCRLEAQRRSLPVAPLPVSVPKVPPSGEARRRWLRSRLEQLLLEETSPCSETAAVAALEILALFETATGELFADTPGTRLASRVSGIGRVLGNITREVHFDPPLQQFSRRGRAYWNRRPHAFMDAVVWKACVLDAEQFALPIVRLRDQLVECNAGLAEWVRRHRYLTPIEVESGESGMALLMLWEVDHGRPFPRQGGDSTSAQLLGFTRRLQARVQEDAELRAWLTCKYMQRPLAPGLPAAHHSRWSVRIVKPAPTEPQGWYDEFLRRWRQHLEELAGAGMQPTVLQSVAVGTPLGADVASSSSDTVVPPPVVMRERPPGGARQRTLPSRRTHNDPMDKDPPGKRPHKRRQSSPAKTAPSDDAASPPQLEVPMSKAHPVHSQASLVPCKRRRTHGNVDAAPLQPLVQLVDSCPDPMVDPSPVRQRSEDLIDLNDQPPRKKLRDLRAWLAPKGAKLGPPQFPEDVASSSSSRETSSGARVGHGRATQGPPT